MEDRARQWREDELSVLASFIDEQQQWINSVLTALEWSEERVKQGGKGQPLLMQCPCNQHHFIDKNSLEKHKLKCRYSVVGVVSDDEEAESGSTFVRISPSIIQAVKKYAQITNKSSVVTANPVHQQRRDVINQSDVVVESHDQLPSLESRITTPQDLLAQGPLHIIRYIKSWSRIPADFHQISGGALNPVEVKGWLFTNLPNKHTYSSQLGGEIKAVEVVLQALTGRPAVTPDSIVTQLTPLFSQQCRSFVLRLWKFLHVVALQKQHAILDSVVEELSPLPLSAISFLKDGEEDAGGTAMEADSFSDKIQAIAAEAASPLPPLPPLPVDTVLYLQTPEERRLVYDYVVEVGGSVQGSQSKDPSLFRDDAAAIKAKLKQQAREESEKKANEGEKGRGGGGGGGREAALYQIKRERDYRRRRQKYRAQNVHITRRTPAQVMRDIINARMQELSGESLLVREKAPPKQDEPEWNRDEVTPLSSSNDRDTNPEQGINVDNSQELSRSEAVSQGATSEQLHGREGKLEYDSRSRRGHGEGSKSREWSQRSISRERSRRSNSRERSQRSRSREKAMGKRSRSRSRERRHDRHSQCDHKDRDRHRKRSRDRDSRTYKKGELPVRDKHHHSSRSGDKGKKKKGKDRSGSMEKRSDS